MGRMTIVMLRWGEVMGRYIVLQTLW